MHSLLAQDGPSGLSTWHGSGHLRRLAGGDSHTGCAPCGVTGLAPLVLLRGRPGAGESTPSDALTRRGRPRQVPTGSPEQSGTRTPPTPDRNLTRSGRWWVLPS